MWNVDTLSTQVPQFVLYSNLEHEISIEIAKESDTELCVIDMQFKKCFYYQTSQIYSVKKLYNIIIFIVPLFLTMSHRSAVQAEQSQSQHIKLFLPAVCRIPGCPIMFLTYVEEIHCSFCWLLRSERIMYLIIERLVELHVCITPVVFLCIFKLKSNLILKY